MDRRDTVLALLALGAAATPLAAVAQQPARAPRVGYLFSFTPAEGRHLWEACRKGLHELGYTEGQNIILEPRWAEGQYERLPGLVAELLRLKVDVMVVAATPGNLAAKAATGTTPIVMVAVGEPVKAGLVANFARPGANVTGLSLLTPELSGRRLNLLMEASRPMPRVAVLMNPRNLVHAVFLEETQVAARKLGTQIQPQMAGSLQEIDQAFAVIEEGKAGALIVFDDPVLWGHRARIVALAAKWRIPAMYGYREFVDEGGLMSYGPDRIDHYRRTASYVDRILKGAKPGDLPIEQPTKFELVINMRAAKALALAVPQSLLLQADEAIQ